MNSTALQQPQIDRGTITVANIYPAKAAGKSAFIKDTDGMLFGIWPDKLGLIKVGATYEIEFTANNKNGTIYRDIKQVHLVEQAQPQQQPRSLSSAAAPKDTQPQNGGYYRPTAPKDARRMFLTATLGKFIETGRIDLHRESMKIAIVEILAAYDATVALEDGS